MTEKFVWMLCLGLVGTLVVSVAAPALPTAVSVVDDETIEPPEPNEDAEPLLEETGGEGPSGGAGGSLPAEWIVLGVGVIGLAVLARIGRSSTERIPLVLGIGLAVAVLGWLVISGWDGSSSPVDTAIPNSFPLVVTALLLALGIGGTALLLARSETVTPSLDPTADPTETEDQPGLRENDADAVASIDDAVPADNDVYRTWRTLAESVERHADEAATPGDVRDAAIDRGFDADSVAALTRLFEDSRYGDRDPTPDRERQARKLHRELHSTEDEPDA